MATEGIFCFISKRAASLTFKLHVKILFLAMATQEVLTFARASINICQHSFGGGIQ